MDSVWINGIFSTIILTTIVLRRLCLFALFVPTVAVASAEADVIDAASERPSTRRGSFVLAVVVAAAAADVYVIWKNGINRLLNLGDNNIIQHCGIRQNMVSAWRNKGSNRNWFRDVSGYIQTAAPTGCGTRGITTLSSPTLRG